MVFIFPLTIPIMRISIHFPISIPFVLITKLFKHRRVSKTISHIQILDSYLHLVINHSIVHKNLSRHLLKNDFVRNPIPIPISRICLSNIILKSVNVYIIVRIVYVHLTLLWYHHWYLHPISYNEFNNQLVSSWWNIWILFSSRKMFFFSRYSCFSSVNVPYI